VALVTLGPVAAIGCGESGAPASPTGATAPDAEPAVPLTDDPAETADDDAATADADATPAPDGDPAAAAATDASDDADAAAAPATAASAGDASPPSATFGPRSGRVAGSVAREIVVTGNLPTPLAATAPGIEARGDAIVAALSATVASRHLQPDGPVTRLAEPPRGQVMVRVAAGYQPAASGSFAPVTSAMARAGQVAPPILRTDAGDALHPVGQVIVETDGDMRIQYDTSMGGLATSRSPMLELNAGDTIYLYYAVPPGSTITRWETGRTHYPTTLKTPG